MMPIRAFEADLRGIRTLGPDVRVTLIRDPAIPDEPVLLVAYPAATSDPAGRDVWIDADNRDWTSGRGITFRVKPDQPTRLSVSFIDRNGVAYTSWSELEGGRWQRVEIPFDTIERNPYFQPPDADTGSPLDVSDVKRIGFAPQSPEAGHLVITRFLVASK